MFAGDDRPDTLSLGDGRKRKSSSRRSSILKVSKSPTRGALCDLDPNAPQEDNPTVTFGTKTKKRLSRRVSFAETYHVKEFIKDSDSTWTNAAAAASATVQQEVEPEGQTLSPDEHTDTAPVLSGLETLLTGAIQNECEIGYSDQHDQHDQEVMTKENSPVKEVPMPNDSYDSEAQRMATQNQTVNVSCDMDVTGCYGSLGMPDLRSSTNGDNNITLSSSSHPAGRLPVPPMLSGNQHQNTNSGIENDSRPVSNSVGNKYIPIPDAVCTNNSAPPMLTTTGRALNQTQMFEDNAGMEMTRCLSTTIQTGQNSLGHVTPAIARTFSAWDDTVTKVFSPEYTASMDFTMCGGQILTDKSYNAGNQLFEKTNVFGNETGMMDVTQCQSGGILLGQDKSEKIDTRSFLSKIMSKTSDSSQLHMNREYSENCETKIDTKSFLSRIMSSKTNSSEEKVDSQSFLRQLTNGSTKIIASSAYNNSDKTRIFGDDATGLMEFTQCQTQVTNQTGKIDTNSILSTGNPVEFGIRQLGGSSDTENIPPVSSANKIDSKAFLARIMSNKKQSPDKNKRDALISPSCLPQPSDTENIPPVSSANKIDSKAFLARIMSSKKPSPDKNEGDALISQSCLPQPSTHGSHFSSTKSLATRTLNNESMKDTEKVDAKACLQQQTEIALSADVSNKKRMKETDKIDTKSFLQRISSGKQPVVTLSPDEESVCPKKKIKLFSNLIEDENNQLCNAGPAPPVMSMEKEIKTMSVMSGSFGTSDTSIKKSSNQRPRNILQDITHQFESKGTSPNAPVSSALSNMDKENICSGNFASKGILERTVNFQLEQNSAAEMEMTRCVAFLPANSTQADMHTGNKTVNFNLQNEADNVESMDFTACLGGIDRTLLAQMTIEKSQSSDSQVTACMKERENKSVAYTTDTVNIPDSQRDLSLQKRGLKRKSFGNRTACFNESDSLDLTRCVGNISIMSCGNLDVTTVTNSQPDSENASNATQTVFPEEAGDIDLTACSGPAERTEDLQFRIAEIIGSAADDFVSEGEDIKPIETLANGLSSFVSEVTRQTPAHRIGETLHSKSVLGEKTCFFGLDKTCGMEMTTCVGGLEQHEDARQLEKTSAENRTLMFGLDKTAAMEMTACVEGLETQEMKNQCRRTDLGEKTHVFGSDSMEMATCVGGLRREIKHGGESEINAKAVPSGFDKTDVMEITGISKSVSDGNMSFKRTNLGDKTCLFGTDNAGAMEMTMCAGRKDGQVDGDGIKGSNQTVFGDKTYLFGLDKTGGMEITMCVGSIENSEIDDRGVNRVAVLPGKRISGVDKTETIEDEQSDDREGKNADLGEKTQLFGFDKLGAMEMTTCVGKIEETKKEYKNPSNLTVLGEKTQLFGIDKSGIMEMTTCVGKIEETEKYKNSSNLTVLGEKTQLFLDKAGTMEMTTCVGRIEDAENEESIAKNVETNSIKKNNGPLSGDKTHDFELEKKGAMEIMTCVDKIENVDIEETIADKISYTVGCCDYEMEGISSVSGKIEDNNDMLVNGVDQVSTSKTQEIVSGRLGSLRARLGTLERSRITSLDTTTCSDEKDISIGDHSVLLNGDTTTNMNTTMCTGNILGSATFKRRRSVFDRTRIFNSDTTAVMDMTTCTGGILGDKTLIGSKSLFEKTNIYTNDPMAALDFTKCDGGILEVATDRSEPKPELNLNEQSVCFLDNADVPKEDDVGDPQIRCEENESALPLLSRILTNKCHEVFKSPVSCNTFGIKGERSQMSTEDHVPLVLSSTTVPTKHKGKERLISTTSTGSDPTDLMDVSLELVGSIVETDQFCQKNSEMESTKSNVTLVNDDSPSKAVYDKQHEHDVAAQPCGSPVPDPESNSRLTVADNSMLLPKKPTASDVSVPLHMELTVPNVPESILLNKLTGSDVPTSLPTKVTLSTSGILPMLHSKRTAEIPVPLPTNVTTSGASTVLPTKVTTSSASTSLISKLTPCGIPQNCALPSRQTCGSNQSCLEPLTTSSHVGSMGRNSSISYSSLSCLEPRLTIGQNLSSISGIEDLPLVNPMEGNLENVEDYLKLIDPIFFLQHKPTRRSTMAPISAVVDESFKGLLELGAVVDPQVEVYEWACEQMTQQIEGLEAVCKECEEKLIADPPQIFKDITSKKNVSAVKTKFMKEIAEPCRKRAKREFKDWRKKIVMSINDAIVEEEADIDQGIDEVMQRLENFNECSYKFARSTTVLENFLHLKKTKPSFGSRSGSYPKITAVKEKLKSAKAELKQKRQLKLERLHQLSNLRQEENRLQQEIFETEHFIVETSTTPCISKEAVEGVVEDMESINVFLEWDMEHYSIDSAEYTFFYKTLALLIQFGEELDLPLSLEKKPRRILTISFDSRLSEDSADYSQLAHRLVLGTLDTSVLLQQCQDTRHLPELLDKVSSVVCCARHLGDDICDAELTHNIQIHEDEPFCINIEFSSLKAFAKFNLDIHIPTKIAPDGEISWDFTSEIGDVRQSDIANIVDAVGPTVKNFGNIVEEVDRFLDGKPRPT